MGGALNAPPHSRYVTNCRSTCARDDCVAARMIRHPQSKLRGAPAHSPTVRNSSFRTVKESPVAHLWTLEHDSVSKTSEAKGACRGPWMSKIMKALAHIVLGMASAGAAASLQAVRLRTASGRRFLSRRRHQPN